MSHCSSFIAHFWQAMIVSLYNFNQPDSRQILRWSLLIWSVCSPFRICQCESISPFLWLDRRCHMARRTIHIKFLHTLLWTVCTLRVALWRLYIFERFSLVLTRRGHVHIKLVSLHKNQEQRMSVILADCLNLTFWACIGNDLVSCILPLQAIGKTETCS